MSDVEDERHHCEGNHDVYIPAVCTMSLVDSMSAANLSFACRTCIMEFVIESFDDPEVVGYEIRRYP